MIRDGIKTLSHISKKPIRVVHYLTKYIQRFPFVLTYLIFIQWIQKHWKDINITDSIFLHNLTNFNNRSLIIYKEILPIISSRSNRKPKVVGIIPDGNRRWSKSLPGENNTPSFGHFCGAYTIANMMRWSIVDPRVSHLVVYLLTYDNYVKRSQEEQTAIRGILNGWVNEFEVLNKSNQADIAIIGEPDNIFRECLGGLPINPTTRDMSKTRISLLLCYDGRREIQQSGGNPDNLWLKEDIDIVIRTGFTQRSSGFCTYQTSYSEYFYPGIYWPEFTIPMFHHLLEESYKVKQNYGK